MAESKSIYRKIIGATSLFGGVQVINMLCSLIRNKIIALLLGAEGVGMISLFNSSVEMVSSLTNLGLRQSSVRDVATAHKKGEELLRKVSGVVRKLSLVLGLFGAMVFIGAAPLLSKVTFGNDQNIWSFVFLSAALLFNALASGEQAILQGSEKLKIFARSTVAGSVTSLLVSIPLYYYLGLRGVVPSLLLASLFTFLFNYIASKKSNLKSEKTTVKTAFNEGAPMLKLGVYMTISGFMTTFLNYVLIAWMNRYASMTEVGYYQAGFTLVTRYVGLIFIAMSTEYYPRLASVHNDREQLSLQVSRQMESSLLMLLPIVTLFLVLQNWIIPLLYKSDFVAVASYTTWAMPGVVFKAISWSLGFILLAKGEGKLFLITELISDVTSIVINILLYLNLGLEGLGIAYTLNFMIYTTYMWIISCKRYGFMPEKSFYIVFLVSAFLIYTQAVVIDSEISKYLIPSLFAVVATIYSLIALRKRLSTK
ncbi:MAG: O-antigen translocase [Muribaculaceae bacterium]|nr:O-antigen translocase [Muribaculaceae bacterium]